LHPAFVSTGTTSLTKLIASTDSAPQLIDPQIDPQIREDNRREELNASRRTGRIRMIGAMSIPAAKVGAS
jgi:hypothetical protein